MLRISIALFALSLLDTIAAEGPANYYADLGPYGTFEMEIAADGSSMKWASKLQSIDQLEVSLGVSIPSLTYHLHQQWTTADADYDVGGDGCGPNVTGGHYDPFLGCGPASGVSTEQCLAIDKARTADRYNCSPDVYSGGAYFECEVGDLSGKDGPITVSTDGKATKIVDSADPLAPIAAQYIEDRVAAPADRFGSIVFHIGSPRVLCGKLMEGSPPDGSAFEATSSALRVVSVWSVVLMALFQWLAY